MDVLVLITVVQVTNNYTLTDYSIVSQGIYILLI